VVTTILWRRFPTRRHGPASVAIIHSHQRAGKIHRATTLDAVHEPMAKDPTSRQSPTDIETSSRQQVDSRSTSSGNEKVAGRARSPCQHAVEGTSVSPSTRDLKDCSSEQRAGRGRVTTKPMQTKARNAGELITRGSSFLTQCIRTTKELSKADNEQR
jgi:hypothetical protein